jgi:hypothetical protein
MSGHKRHGKCGRNVHIMFAPRLFEINIHFGCNFERGRPKHHGECCQKDENDRQRCDKDKPHGEDNKRADAE